MNTGGGLPVQWWPVASLATHDGLAVIGIGGSAGRDDARLRIRAALAEAIAQLAGVAPGAVMIQSWPGRAPAVSFREPTAIAPPAIAISHDGALSLAAIDLRGAVGLDLMRVQDVPDWRAVAHDYLGPDAPARLAGTAPALRAAAFARAWTEHEARLKCHGLQLAEWTPQLARLLADCRCTALQLPEGYAGTVAQR